MVSWVEKAGFEAEGWGLGFWGFFVVREEGSLGWVWRVGGEWRLGAEGLVKAVMVKSYL